MLISIRNDSPIYEKSAENEAKHLLGMIDEVVESIPKAALPFAPLRAEIDELIGDPVLETVRGESHLELLSMKLRAIWMRIAHAHSDRHMKSPLQGDKITFPMGRNSSCGYERVVSPKNLEARCEDYRPTPSGWRSRHLVFRSGMASITSCFQNLRPHLFDDDHEPVICDFFGGYYETKRVFDMFTSPQLSFRRHARQDELFEAIEQGDGQLLFLEPVS